MNHLLIERHTFPLLKISPRAVYVTLSGVKSRSHALLVVEHIFFFLNIALFLLNTSTLTLQLFCMSRVSSPRPAR